MSLCQRCFLLATLTLTPSSKPSHSKDLPCFKSYVLSRFSSVRLCNPMDRSLPGSSVHVILQARTLEWVASPIPRDLPNPGIKPRSLTSPALQAGRFLTASATWEVPLSHISLSKCFIPLYCLSPLRQKYIFSKTECFPVSVLY